MVTLPQLLQDARARRASEIVLQSGQRPRLQTLAGPAELEQVLSESDLFDALTQVLAPDQQAELAVGNVVEFNLEDHGGWSLVTEPSSDGVVVRGRSRNGGASAGPAPTPSAGSDDAFALELPPLEPFRPDDHEVTSGTSRRPSRGTRFDIGVDYGAADPDLPPPRSAGLGAPAASAARPATAPSPSAVSPIGPPPTVANLEPASDGSFERWDGGAPSSPAPETRVGDLGQLARSVARGTLCLWHDDGSEDIGGHLSDGPLELVDEGSLPAIVALSLDEIPPPEVTWLVRLEDPSRCLGFVLRRLEEGARVVVHTRACTGAGGLRSLLGTAAGPSGAHWLAAHPRRFLVRREGAWSLEVL